MIPVVIDTGVFAAGVFWRKEGHACVNAWLQGLVSLVVTPPIYREYERTLRKIKAAHGFTTDVDRWLAVVQDHAQWAEPCPLVQ